MRPAEIADLNHVKNFLILFLSAMLALGALMSRPGEESFRAQMRRQLLSANVPSSTLTDKRIEEITEGWVFKDRYLWSEVEVDGHTVYAGVFSRWIPMPESVDGKPGTMLMARDEHGND